MTTSSVGYVVISVLRVKFAFIVAVSSEVVKPSKALQKSVKLLRDMIELARDFKSVDVAMLVTICELVPEEIGVPDEMLMLVDVLVTLGELDEALSSDSVLESTGAELLDR